MSQFIFVVIGVLSLSAVEGAKILAVFPMPSISHQVVFRPLTQELAKRGHEVTVITADPAFPKGETPANLTEIDVHDLSYNMWIERFSLLAPKGGDGDLEVQVELMLRIITEMFEAQTKMDEVKEILTAKNTTYDLILLEACVRPALVISHLFKAPVILVSSLGAVPGNYDMVGASEHPTLYPGFFHFRTFNTTMLEKFIDVYRYYVRRRMIYKSFAFENEMIKNNFGADVPTIQELSKNVDMLLLNSNPVFDGIVPVPPNVIFMGGLHQKPTKPLPADLQNYLDSSKNGVVYVSFGTNVDPTLLPTEKVQTLVKVFSKLPYDVLFKWNGEELPGRSKNIKISKWLPQSDMLKHPKIKLFITQAGLQSTDEAITAGVPLIAIPMLADQWFNADRYVYHGIGIKLEMETLTEKLLRNAIDTIVNDDSYRQNAAKLRNLIEDQPMKPLERAVWWTEYVIRHGGAKHLRSPAANISWAQFFELELVFTVLGVLSLILTVVVSSMCFVYKYLSSKCLVSKLKSH